ncbi:hypothetical protein TYRP_001017 [Tyrophagus putrescentiae]|nr:hypothetical protein TYRP_001017 [Tyrophagus putrescentiae]
MSCGTLEVRSYCIEGPELALPRCREEEELCRASLSKLSCSAASLMFSLELEWSSVVKVVCEAGVQICKKSNKNMTTFRGQSQVCSSLEKRRPPVQLS